MAKRKTFYVSTNVFDAGLSTAAIAVYAYLAYCSNADGTSYPPVKTIAAHCGISENTVRKAIRELTDKRLIQKEENYMQSPNGNHRQQANTYRLLGVPCKSCTPAAGEGVSLHLLKGRGSPVAGEINSNSNRVKTTRENGWLAFGYKPLGPTCV